MFVEWSGVQLLRAPLFSSYMADTNQDCLAQLTADRERLNKLARLVILRKGLILQFESPDYIIDWLDSNHVEHGVAHQQFRKAIDKLSEDPLLSLCPISDEIQ